MRRIVSAAFAAIVVLSIALTGTSAALDTNNFRISSYDISYELFRTSENRSELKTVEVVTAEFPSFNQNHGLERAIPTRYNGHSTELTITSVTDQNNKALPYSTTNSSDMALLRIGDADAYVHGSQTYRISYTQHDVTRYFEDNSRDEWYWDTNGTEWRVPIDKLSVSVKIDASLRAAQVGEPQCYFGAAKSTARCEVTQNAAGEYTTTVNDLKAGENVTLAYGFTPNTFAAYQMPIWEKVLTVWAIVQSLTGMLAFVLGIIIVTLAVQRYYRTKDTHPIVAEYIPPKDASVTIASQVVSDKARSAFSAQLIDLAVRRYIAIIETKEKSMWRPAEYDIQIIGDVETLREEEKEILSDMYGHMPGSGERIALSSLRSNTAYFTRTTDNVKKFKHLVHDTYKLRESSPAISASFYKWGKWLIAFAILTLSVPLLFVAIIAFIIGKTLKPLNDKGIALRRYVLGLDKYISASETERLAFLQGPDTAEKVGFEVDATDSAQLVKLYERTLPYAVLFGREKQWASRLGEMYQTAQTSPDWYTGTSVFNAAVFSSTLANFSQASAQAAGYAAGSSSSSGGSSGGGFSGGGGGGGGGGGW